MSDAPDLYPELDELLAEAGDPDTAADRFVIDSPDAANWALRRLAVHAAKLADAEAFAQRERDRLDLWLAGERHQAEQSSSFLAGLLRRYHEDRLAEDPKAKTIRLPAGELTARKVPAHWDVDDEMVIEWAQGNGWGEVVRQRDPEVDRPALKRTFHVTQSGTVVAPDGEVVPGITVTEGELSFKVRPKVDGQ